MVSICKLCDHVIYHIKSLPKGIGPTMSAEPVRSVCDQAVAEHMSTDP